MNSYTGYSMQQTCNSVLLLNIHVERHCSANTNSTRRHSTL